MEKLEQALANKKTKDPLVLFEHIADKGLPKDNTKTQEEKVTIGMEYFSKILKGEKLDKLSKENYRKVQEFIDKNSQISLNSQHTDISPKESNER